MSHFQVKKYTHRIFLWLCALSLFLTIWLDGFLRLPASTQSSSPARTAIAQSTEVSQLVRDGIERYELGKFSEAIELWKTAYGAYESTQDLPAVAVVSENLARAYQQLGQPSEEIAYWNRAIAAIQASNNAVSADNMEKLGRLLVEQAQTYSRLGQPRRAIAILCGTQESTCTKSSALQMAIAAEDVSTQIAAFGSLGEAYRLRGDEDAAIQYLEEGLALSQSVDRPALESAILNGLGAVYIRMADIRYRQASEAQAQESSEAATLQAEAKESNKLAFAALQESYNIAIAQQDKQVQLRALLSLIPVKVRAGELASAEQHRKTAIAIATQLPDSEVKAFALLKLADLAEEDDLINRLSLSITSGLELSQTETLKSSVEDDMTQLLNQALTIGEKIGNPQVTAFALGKLGQLDERANRYEAAIEHTQAARLAANQNAAAKESLYLWDWQMGRLLRTTGREEAAKQSYAQAVALIEQIRRETLSTSDDLQFDFRDTVEPIYRQYVSLSLKTIPDTATLRKGEPDFEALDKALLTIDALKVAELQSYFANDCIIAPITTKVDALDDSRATAVVSTAILGSRSLGLADKNEQRLVAIATLPDGSKKIAQIDADEQTLANTTSSFRKTLELGNQEYISDYDLAPSKQLYEWLIRPFEQDFANVETLVFVNDGLLRNVPMSALYDGQQYLIEKFAVATTPSLTITNSKRVARPAKLSALLMGVSNSSEVTNGSFAPLPAVDEELAKVAQILPNSKTLLNEELSLATLRSALADTNYRILHVATHGTFGFDPVDNYVVLGAKRADQNRLNEVLTIGQLDKMIRETSNPNRNPVELLTLTACETAKGSTRATLGFAGVAVRAGVRSAIATLWSVGDASSAQLISDFYANLQDVELTKAKALQNAQIAMIRSEDPVNRHPYRWAPFVLIGNWL